MIQWGQEDVVPLLEEMSFQPVVEDNSDVLTGVGLEVSQ